MISLTYLQGYPEHLLAQVRTLIAEQRLGAVLENVIPARMITPLTKRYITILRN